MCLIVLLFLTNGCKKNIEDSDLFTPAGTVTDIDNNIYNAIKIGTQIWMVENLRTTRYCNGDPIPNITDLVEFSELTTGGFCTYNNTTNTETINIYGRLYNLFAVKDSRGLCPASWHVASSMEWETLSDYVGKDAGAKLKDTHGWLNGGNGTNISGFSALPGGYCYGGFNGIGDYAYWWSSDGLNPILQYDSDLFGINRYYIADEAGHSVRCIKN